MIVVVVAFVVVDRRIGARWRSAGARARGDDVTDRSRATDLRLRRDFGADRRPADGSCTAPGHDGCDDVRVLDLLLLQQNPAAARDGALDTRGEGPTRREGHLSRQCTLQYSTRTCRAAIGVAAWCTSPRRAS